MNILQLANSTYAPSASRLMNKLNAGISALIVSAGIVSTSEALVVNTNTLPIAPNGQLDVQVSNVIVRSGNYATLSALVASGYSSGPNGYWDGKGIISSIAASDDNTGVGIVNNAELGYASWPPLEPVLLTSGLEILLKYTYYGDGDLSGSVNSDDYLFFLAGLNNDVGSSPVWLYGDYDYTGAVNSDDFLFFLSGFGATPPLVSQGGIAAVPEPASMGLLIAGAFGLFIRRRNGRAQRTI